ncbi:shikimate kinase [Ornithinibacillus caprae]|nr:shikimate kinase [Ornithinibacillus caprae]
MDKLFLIGFMGSGKSTVGKKLSLILNTSYIDTDSLIEETYQKKIPAIFKEEGENAFRKYETDILHTVTAEIVSTGGGIVEKDENVKWMQKNGVIIYLQSNFDEITTRLEKDSFRPLWDKSLADRRKLYIKRVIMYEQYADLVIDTTQKDIEAIAHEIIHEYTYNYKPNREKYRKEILKG